MARPGPLPLVVALTGRSAGPVDLAGEGVARLRPRP